MSKYLLMAALVLTSVMALACQAYNEGYNKGMTRGAESAAIMNLHKIVLAQQDYSLNKGGYGTFHQLIQDGSLDERYDSDKPKVNEYLFIMTITPKGTGTQKDSYCINGDPAGPDPRGRHFYLDVSGLIHANASQPATANDPLLKDPELDQLLGTTLPRISTEPKAQTKPSGQ